MKSLQVGLLIVAVILILAGLVSALGVKLDVVKTCDASGGAYTTTWTGTVNDTNGSPITTALLTLSDYGPDMFPWQSTGTGSGSNAGFYIAQFPVWPYNGGHRYQMDARKTGYDSATLFVILPCFEDTSYAIQHGQERYVLYGNFTLKPVVKLQAAFVYTQSYARADFFDRSSGGPDQWTWTFGDGSSSVLTTQASITHNYSKVGTFAVVMKAQRVYANPATSYAYANVTITATAPPGGGTSPPPPPPPPPPGSCDALTDPSCPGYVPPSGGQSDNPPGSSGSGGDASSPNGPDPSGSASKSTIFTPSLVTVILLILGLVLLAVAVLIWKA